MNNKDFDQTTRLNEKGDEKNEMSKNFMATNWDLPSRTSDIHTDEDDTIELGTVPEDPDYISHEGLIEYQYIEGEKIDKTYLLLLGFDYDEGEFETKDFVLIPDGALPGDCDDVELRVSNFSMPLGITIQPFLCTKTVPATKEFSLCGGLNGTLYLGKGEEVIDFTDIEAGNSTLSLQVKHVYVSSGTDYSCGRNWRLNLHQTLKKSEPNKTHYEYLTKETVNAPEYIYEDENNVRYGFEEVFYYIDNGVKCTLNGASVSVDADGNMYWFEYKDDHGIDHEVFREFVTPTGLKLSTKLDIPNAAKLEQRTEEIANLEQTIEQLNIQINELEMSVAHQNELKKKAPIPDSSLTANMASAANFAENDTLEIRIEKVQTRLQDLPYSDTEQGYDPEQKALNDYLTKLNKQLETVTKSYLTTRNKKNEEQLDTYKILLGQKENELKHAKSLTPVAYLTDDSGRFLCFNEDGNLCAIIDSYQNYIVIEWDHLIAPYGNNVIAAVYDGDHKSVFEYNRDGLLTAITDYNGNRVTYSYDDTKQLTSVAFSDGRKIDMAYNIYGRIKEIRDTDCNAVYLYHQDCQLTDVVHKTTFNEGEEQQASKITFGYDDHQVTVTQDEVNQTIFLDYYGGLSGGFQTINGNSDPREPLTFSYLSKDKKWGYRVSSLKGATFETFPDSSNDARFDIDVEKLAPGCSNFQFSACAAFKNENGTLGDTGMPFVTSFGQNGDLNRTPVYQLRAEIKYSDETVAHFRAGFDYKNKHKQLMALPITIDRSKTLKSITLYAEADVAVSFSNLRFSPAEWEFVECNDFGCVLRKETSEHCIQYDEVQKQGTYKKYVTTYEYNKNNQPLLEKTIQTISGAITREKVFITKNSYCEHGNLVKSESYVEDEVGTSGIFITERVCDDRGNVIKEFSYNSLDSSTKFYTESEYAENGTTTAVIDETGEYKTELVYADGTTQIKAQKLPNGSKFAYGYDARGTVTAITQSTADGEENSINIYYEKGCPTRLTSGNNVVYYEYDHKRRKTKVTVNGEDINFSYAEDVTSPNEVTSDKVTKTERGITQEVYTNQFGDTVYVKVDDTTQCACDYNDDRTLDTSADLVTGSNTVYTYSSDVTKKIAQVAISAGSNVEALTENYTFSEYGELDTRELNGTVSHTYKYNYKNNAARDLEYVTLPNGLRAYPQKDCNGRNKGKILTGAEGNLYGEYIYYRKVGDHGTNMPSAIYYGINNSEIGKYAISDSVKYRYDKMGNIVAILENGTMSVRYSYDSLNRLVREDNKKLNKSFFFAYDNCGNILGKRTAAYTLKPEEALDFAEEIFYAYDGDRLLSYNGDAIVYENGNPIHYRGNTLSWEHGKLKQFGGTIFSYDGYGRRIKKGNTVFAYDANSRLIKQSDSTNTLEFFYDESGLSGVRYNGTDYIYRKNAQGDITHIYDATSGMVVAKYAYDAWGNHKVYDEFDNENADTGFIGNVNAFRYRSYFFDSETKLYYLKTRYYDPEIGRFISQDDVSYLDPEHINGLNLYAYCENNPVMECDPTGAIAISTFIITCLIGFAIGTVIGGISGIGKQIQTNGWNPSDWNWIEIGFSALGGGISGLISAMDFGLKGLLSYVVTFLVGGIGAVFGGWLNGSITDWQSAITVFLFGGLINVAGKIIGDTILDWKASKIFNQRRKAKSLAVQKLQAKINGEEMLKGRFVNAFKDTSFAEISKMLQIVNPLLKYNFYSTLGSNLLGGLL